MANNFKITDGVRYVSKSGHDSNDGLTPDTPTRLIPTLPGGKIVIGSGVYENPLGYSGQFIGDGEVILKNSATVGGSAAYRSTEFLRFENIYMTPLSGNGRGWVARNCTFKNCTGMILYAIGTVNGVLFQSCDYNKFINSQDEFLSTDTKATSITIRYSILINSRVACNFIIDTYIDKNSIIDIKILMHPFNRVSNIEGVLRQQGVFFADNIARDYAIKDQLIGTPQDNGYRAGVNWLSEAQLISDGWTGSTAGAQTYIDEHFINRPPLFNNASIDDFTLQAASPHILLNENVGGTEPSISIINSDNNGNNIIVVPSANVDTTTSAWTVNAGEIEAYIDYFAKIGDSPLLLREISPISTLEFDSDITGGTIGNRNVPDSEPLTFEYPRKLTTTSAAIDTFTLNVTAHDMVVGEYVRVAGEDRLITATTANTVTVDAAFRAIVGTGITFQVGEKVRIGALNPNRLTFMMRTSKEDNPQVDSDWDNDIDPVYNKVGAFLTQEWGEVPGYYIDSSNNEVWGSGDSETPPGLTKNEISCKWVHIRVYIRNNYES